MIALNRFFRKPSFLSGQILGLALGLTLVATLGFAGDIESTRFDPDKFWRSADLREGMKGYGLTVFHGVEIERFDVEILGVLHDRSGKTDAILARCSGGPLEKTGVIAGMSGSPIYIEDKLIGALAFAFPFSKEPLAGITPIEAMLAVLDQPTTESGGGLGKNTSPGVKKISSPGGASMGAGPNSTPRDWAKRFSAFLRKDYDSALAGFEQERVNTPLDRNIGLHSPDEGFGLQPFSSQLGLGEGSALVPIAMPLSIRGLPNDLFDTVASRFKPLGFLPVPGGPPAAFPDMEIAIEPGAALGVSLVEGDANFAGIGTVTYVDGDQVLGFGHPMSFTMDGSIDLPMSTAYINLLVPNLMLSFKYGAPVRVIGALEQDRRYAVGGTVGKKAQTIPMRIQITNKSAGKQDTFNYNLAQHRFYSPLLALVCVFDSFSSVARPLRDEAADFILKVHLKDRDPVILTDQVSSTMGTAFSIGGTFSALLDLLLKNPYERVAVEGLELDVNVTDRLQQSTIEWVGVDNSTVRAGEELAVRVAVQTWLGESEVLEHSIQLPEDMEPGFVKVGVSDAIGHLMTLQQRNPDYFRPRKLDDILRLLNEEYRNDRLFITVSKTSPGASAFGVEMPDLPSSVLRVVAAAPDRGTGSLILTESIIEDRVELKTPLTGSGSILVEVKPPRNKRLE